MRRKLGFPHRWLDTGSLGLHPAYPPVLVAPGGKAVTLLFVGGKGPYSAPFPLSKAVGKRKLISFCNILHCVSAFLVNVGVFTMLRYDVDGHDRR